MFVVSSYKHWLVSNLKPVSCLLLFKRWGKLGFCQKKKKRNLVECKNQSKTNSAKGNENLSIFFLVAECSNHSNEHTRKLAFGNA